MRTKHSISMISLFVFLAVLCLSVVSSEAKVTIKLPHENAVGGPLDEAFNYFAKRAGELTNGDIEVKIFPAGQLGDEAAIMEGVTVGTLDAGGGALLARIEPMWNAVFFPFLFRDAQHVQKVLNGPIGAEMKERTLKKGIKVMASFEPGFHNFLNNKRPVYTPEDLKGLKLRIMGVPVYMEAAKAYGIVTVGLPYGEVYTGIRQGVVDGCEGSFIAIMEQKWHEVVKYISLANWASARDYMFLSARLWNSLSPQNQKALEQAGKECEDFYNKIYEKALEEGFDAVLKAGIKVNLVYQPAFYPIAEKVWKMYEKDVPASVTDRIKATK